MKFAIYMVATMLGVLATGCGGTSTDAVDDLATARKEIADKNYTSAQGMLDRIDIDGCQSPSDLSEMAVLYMMINDGGGSSDGNDYKALDCYRRAMSINADSVAAYVRTLPAEEAQYLFMLGNLAGSLDNPADLGDFYGEEEPES